MAKDFKTRSDEEAKTYELFHTAVTAQDAKWSPSRAAVAIVFMAMWSSALTAPSVVKVAQAMNGMGEEKAIRAALTELTREKVLRSYVKQGQRFYEVNY